MSELFEIQSLLLCTYFDFKCETCLWVFNRDYLQKPLTLLAKNNYVSVHFVHQLYIHINLKLVCTFLWLLMLELQYVGLTVRHINGGFQLNSFGNLCDYVFVKNSTAVKETLCKDCEQTLACGMGGLLSMLLFFSVLELAVAASKSDPPDVLDRQKCLDALAEQRRSKWFQVCSF